MRLARRAALAAAVGGLAGCGWRPVYAPAASGGVGPAEAALAAIDVALIPDRSGQILREDLQQRFEGAGGGANKQYDLTVALALTQEGVNILPDNSATRQRLTSSAVFLLRAQNPAHDLLTSGSARLTESENLFDNQFFASDLEAQAITRRLMAGLADQITLQLAAYFRNHPPAG